MPRKELVRQKIAPQHSVKACAATLGSTFRKRHSHSANDQLLNQRDKPADKLIVKRISQGMVLQALW
jgi:hypothetical protein